jgi:Major intrinsic protein
VIANYVLRGALGNDAVRFAVTAPGTYGGAVALVAEAAISFGLMITILAASNSGALARYTPYLVGALYAIYIAFETPLSGMSMNPARTVGSAFSADYWHALWIYFIAPTLGMLIAQSYTTPTISVAYSSTQKANRPGQEFLKRGRDARSAAKVERGSHSEAVRHPACHD